MSCPRCETPYPPVARFCLRCGADVRALTTAGQARRGVYVAHPREPLLSFSLVTSLMPLASANGPQTYRTALALGVTLPVLAAVLGLLPAAIVGAAVAVPVVYVLYLYDVNQWEDEPVPVVLATIALSGVLGALFTWWWRDGLLGATAFVTRRNEAFVDTKTLLVVGLVVPVGGEILMQLGPLWCATRARFHDLLDALSFGVTSGAAFAAVETIVLNHRLIFSGQSHYGDADTALWIALVMTAMVKAVIYGAATGIACAGFSGLGEGYDGFTRGYWRALAEALAANVAFQLGIYFTGLVGSTTGVVLGLVWSLVVAAAVLLRLRYVLHLALLESALGHVAKGGVPVTPSQDIVFCGECELPLLEDASFCVACGAAVRAASKWFRRESAGPSPSGAIVSDERGGDAMPAAFPAPGLSEWGRSALPPAAARRTGGFIVAAALSTVAMAAVVFALVNLTRDPPTSADPSALAPPIDVNHGPAPAPPAPAITAPGPQPPPTVTLAIATPPPTSAPAPPPTGHRQRVRGRISVVVPKGWHVGKAGDGNVLLTTKGAQYRVRAKPTTSSAQQLVEDWITSVADVDHLEATRVDGPLPNAAAVSTFGTAYVGVLAQVEGSNPVEGEILSYVTQDGIGVLLEAFNARGEFDRHSKDYAAMRDSVIATL